MPETPTSPTTTPEEVLATAQHMLADGLVEGTSGNISGRLPGGRVCLTPSSVAYDTMTLDDLVVLDESGTVLSGHRSPTTEKDLHLSALRRYPELGAVIHTHAVYATMFAVAHEAIPAVIEEVVVCRAASTAGRAPPSWATRSPAVSPTAAPCYSPTTAS